MKLPLLLLIVAAHLALSASAADKNGVSPNSISLPKGPGSVEGLGESFQPTLNTGTAKYSIGIKLPPGTAGHQPSLSLSYDGGGANGPLGYGWALPLPHIQRRTDNGIPTYGQPLGVSRPDVFINEMREQLVPLTNGFFLCENESAFIRYRRVGDHWEGTMPNGTRLEFGLSAAGRIEEESSSRVFCWLLERETDTRGNVIEYVYRELVAGEHQKYLALIRYGPGSAPWSHFHFVAFQYEDRPDWFEDGRAGFLVRTSKRLKRILVGTQGKLLQNHLAGDFDGDGTADYLNRSYELQYLAYAGDASHWSLLSAVTLTGADGATALPAARFDYVVSNPPNVIDASSNVWSGVNEPTFAMDNEFVELADLNADGLPDVLRTDSGGGAHTAWVNLGPVQQGGGWAVQWGAAAEVDPGNGTAWNFNLAADRTHLADMNGDGLADLVHKDLDNAVFFFANRGNLAWGSRQNMTVDGAAPPAPFSNPSVRTADVDFDKRVDIIQSIPSGGGVAYRIWFNVGDQEYSAPFTIEPDGGFDFALTGVQIADCNGDRVPDVARIRPGAVEVATGLGYGRFAATIAMPLTDWTLDEAQMASAKLSDLNGDGLADLILERAAPGQCWYWLNLGNFTFQERKMFTGLPSVASGKAVRWADLNGNGTTDLIYCDSTATPRIQMIEIGTLVNGGLAPNLLSRIENGIGRVTRIDYQPSTRYALADAAAGMPWPDPVPFPVTVVAAVHTFDSLGHDYLTEFRYHDGYYDAAEKQFRGFAHVEQIEIGDVTAPTFVSRSRFDTGRDYDGMKGRLLKVSAETQAGAVFSTDTTTWADPPRILHRGTNGLAVRFAHPVANVREILERGVGTPRQLETEFEFDDYGNQTRQTEYGIVENGDRNAFNDERVTVTEYALNLEKWILRLPKRLLVQDENGAVVSRVESFYDDETFAGNNLGNVSTGNLTLQRAWIDPANPTNFISSARSKYDSFGNPIATFDPLSDGTANPADGHFRELLYDDGFHSFPLREIIHIGGSTPPFNCHAEYDEGLATLRRFTDFNTNVTLYGFDAFGRLTSIVQPGDTIEYPTAEYSYALGVPTGSNYIINFVETRQLDREPGTLQDKRDHYFISRAFVDGLGRPRMTRTEAEPAAASTSPRVVVAGAMLYNARQKPSRALNPFFTTASGSLDHLLAFENIEAEGWQGEFHEGGSLVRLGLASAHQIVTEYDANLRDIRTINPDGSFSRTEYEPLLIRSFDENDTDVASPHAGTPMFKFNDGLGRLIRIDEIVRLNDDGSPSLTPRAWTTRYAYDLNDCHTESIDPQGNVKQMRYDALKRKVWINDPDAGTTTNAYDPASNLTQTMDAKGQRITYSYDGANRILSEDFHDNGGIAFGYGRSPDVLYHYDSSAGQVAQGDGTAAFSRNLRGMLAWVEDCTGEEHTSYDRRGRVEWTVKRLPDPVSSLDPRPGNLISYKTSFAYDSMNRVVRMVYPDNDEIVCRYNARNLLDAIVGGPNGHVISNVAFAPSAQQQQLIYGNGIHTSYKYDSRSRLAGLLTKHSVLNTEFVHFAYDFDRASTLRTISDLRPSATISPENPRRNSQTFDYDDLYRLRLTRYNAPNGATMNGGQIEYRYDRIGNMLAQTSDIAQFNNGLPVADMGQMSYGGAGGTSNRGGRQPGDPPGPHALTAVLQVGTNSGSERPFTYDANGNMATADGQSYTWDFRNRLVAIEDTTMRAEYRYDYKGHRTFKRVRWKNGAGPAGQTNQFTSVTATTYIGKHFEVRDHDQPIKYVFNGATRVAKVTGSISSNLRVQRLRLQTGWNLVSLAVTVNEATALTAATDAAYLWNSSSGAYSALVAGQNIPGNSVLWLRSRTNTVIALTGEYQEPVARMIQAGASFIPAAGLERWDIHVPDTLALAQYDSQDRRWQHGFPGELRFLSDLPRIISPGEALFVNSEVPVVLEIPAPALRITYYHQDHLGSSAAITDADGGLVSETAFHPFGSIRNEHRIRSVDEPFQFTQKERDKESGLDHFGARYYAAGLNRWLSCDPAGAIDGLNPYLYVRNSPTRFVDPEGYDRRNPNEWKRMAAFMGIDPGDKFEWKNFTDPEVAFQAAIEAHKVNNYRGEGKTAEDHAANFFAGIGDMLIGWALDTKKIREQYLNVKIVDENSGAYTAGGIIGVVGGMAAGPKAGGPKTVEANASFGNVRVGNARTSSGVVQGGGGVAAQTVLASELAPTIPNGTMVTGMPSPAVRTAARQTMMEMYADPVWGPRLRKMDATRAERMKVETTDRAKAIDMMAETFK